MAEESLLDLRGAQLNAHFKNSSDGKIYLRTTASGTFVFAGAQTVVRFKEIELNPDTWTELVTDGGYSRVGLSIQNRSFDNPDGLEDIMLNGDNTALNDKGLILHPNEAREYTIISAKLYAKSKSITGYKINIEDLI